MTAPLQLTVSHEGANPQHADGIERLADASFVVRPTSEDGDSNYKFALDVIVENPADAAVGMKLTVDWQEPPEVGTTYMNARRSVFFGDDGRWTESAGRMDGDKVHYELAVPPGRHHVCLNPPYTLEKHLAAFIERGRRLAGSRHMVFGRTAEGRPLDALVLDATDEQREAVLVIGRGHPYETAAAWCVDGVLEHLAGEGEKLRRHRRILLVPVMNPDGAAGGLCKRTTLGCDITAEGRDGTDPTARAVVGLVCGLAGARNAAVWDVHGWMIAQDGMNFATGQVGERVLALTDPALFPNGWRNTQKGDVWDAGTPNFRRYAAGQLGMSVLVTSHPFWGRTPDGMRRVGAAVFEALLAGICRR